MTSWWGKRSGACRASLRLVHMSRPSASALPGSGGQPMSRPQAGPSTPSRGGRFGCPRWALLARLVMLAGLCMPAFAQQLDLPRAALSAGGRVLVVQIAQSPLQQQTGLMHREAMPRDEGMLFVFPADRARCLWMRDTPLALSAAFLDATGRIVEVMDLSARSDEIRCSARPARYVLEMQAGWFVDAGVGVGDVVSGLARDAD